MDGFKKARAPYRRSVTRLSNDLAVLFTSDPVDVAALTMKMDMMQEAYLEVAENDKQIVIAMVGAGASDQDIDKEVQEQEQYSMKVKASQLKLNGIVGVAVSPGTAGTPKRNYKLPEIQLRKFTGDLKDWLQFWSQFEKIHEDKGLHASDKFDYLVQAMQVGSEARELVESYPQSADNYPTVVEALKKRFGNDDLLLQVYVRELLSLVITNVTAKDKIPFQCLYIKLESHLRALKTLKLADADPATWLFPLVESSLPEETLLTWQRSPLSLKDGSAENPPKNRLDYLMEFLSSEVEIRQKISLAQSGFQSMSVSSTGKSEKKNFKEKSDRPTLAGCHSGELRGCIFCGRKHESKDCVMAQKMTIAEKKEKLKSNNCCMACFSPGHYEKKCKAFVKCILCGRKHHVLICPTLEEKQNASSSAKSELPDDQNDTEVTAGMSNLVCTGDVLLGTLMVTLHGNGKSKQVRAFIDNGSQRSYILKKTADELGLVPTSKEDVIHGLFGGRTQAETHKRYNIKLQRQGGSYTFDLNVRDQTNITLPLPRASPMEQGLLQELKRKKIWISDMGKDTPPVEVLIGGDKWARLLTGKVVTLSNGLTAVETHLGWTLSGEKENSYVSVGNTTLSMASTDLSVSDLWNLETIGINDPVQVQSAVEVDEEAKAKLIKTIERKADGRYIVRLPWREGHPELSDNRMVALRRLESATKRYLSNEDDFRNYGKIFKDWEKEGFIERVPTGARKSHFIPHRPVFKPESQSTPVRPVFDCSCKTGKSVSLNDCLYTGPNYVQLIPDLIHRFREKKIGISADIRKAFQMIEVGEPDRDFLRFLWWENEKKTDVIEYRHVRVVFGATCSPFILGAVIEYHLSQASQRDQTAATELLQSLYVDNAITSVNTMEEYEQFRTSSVDLLATAGMDLRAWLTNADQLMDSNEITTILGMLWNRSTDMMSADLHRLGDVDNVTKRTILSTVQKIFDPMGFLAPATITAKILLQQAWVQKIKWDDALPEDVVIKFRKWYAEIESLTQIQIPRLVTGGEFNRDAWSLHTFTDASKLSFACVIFLRVDHGSHVSVQLLTGKARVAPLNSKSIPRLELLGCLIGARLFSSVKSALALENVKEYFWSDSTTAITWIGRNEPWATFVGNRVTEINKLTSSALWRHVPGHLNPADFPSRGCTPVELLRSKWWEGPHWLKLSPSEWPKSQADVNESEVLQERKKSVEVSMFVFDELSKDYTYSQTVRINAWVLRFMYNARQANKVLRRSGPLTLEEKRESEMKVIQGIQRESFPDPDQIRGLRVITDKAGSLRLKTKLIYREDVNNFKWPLLLPQKHPLVYKLIAERHQEKCHAGVGYLMCNLREDYWILQSRRAIRHVIKRCWRCRRFSARKAVAEEGALPVDRVKNADVFEITGVDLCGPLLLKGGKKIWVVIFTCAVFRAIHLELVSSLSSKAFIQALGRFIKNHRRPDVCYSDNGTNFHGADRLFRNLDWSKIQSAHPITWKFNPPSAAWWGGFWERLIRSIKDLMRRMLGKAVLKREELQVVLENVQEVINGRPLTYVSEDPEEPQPLTPAMFMKPTTDNTFPEGELLESEKMRIRYKCVATISEELRQRFRKEYLSQLICRPAGKPRGCLIVGNIVLVEDENRKRIDWRLGRIIELFPGKDGICRVAKVKVQDGELTRPIQRLYSLEVDGSEKEAEPIKSRYGRVLKKTDVFNISEFV